MSVLGYIRFRLNCVCVYVALLAVLNNRGFQEVAFVKSWRIYWQTAEECYENGDAGRLLEFRSIHQRHVFIRSNIRYYAILYCEISYNFLKCFQASRRVWTNNKNNIFSNCILRNEGRKATISNECEVNCPSSPCYVYKFSPFFRKFGLKMPV